GRWGRSSVRPDRSEPGPSPGSLTVGHLVQLRQVPDFHRRVPAAGVQTPTVGAERQATDEAGVTVEGEDQFSGPAVPDLDLAILTARGDPPAVGAERHRVDLPAVPPECHRRLAALLRVPDLDRV